MNWEAVGSFNNQYLHNQITRYDTVINVAWYPGYLEVHGQEEAIAFHWLLTVCTAHF